MYGPTLTVHVLERAATEGVAVGFYGGKSRGAGADAGCVPAPIAGLQRDVRARATLPATHGRGG